MSHASEARLSWTSALERRGEHRPALGRLRAPRPAWNRVVQLARSRNGRLVFTAGLGVFALAIAGLAARHFAETPWPLSRGHPGLLVAAGGLSLLGYGFKAFGWRLLFATHERPQPLALAAANGGASITALALPGGSTTSSGSRSSGASGVVRQACERSASPSACSG